MRKSKLSESLRLGLDLKGALDFQCDIGHQTESTLKDLKEMVSKTHLTVHAPEVTGKARGRIRLDSADHATVASIRSLLMEWQADLV